MHSMSVLSSIIFIRLSVAILECCKLICMHLICVCILFDLLQCIVLVLRKSAISVIRGLPYFSKIACKIGQFLSSEEWLVQIFLFWLYLVYVRYLMHLNCFGGAVHSFILCLSAQRGHISSPLQSRNLGLYVEHLKHIFATM